jgi:S-formylglutathione hydrolase FrmB
MKGLGTGQFWNYLSDELMPYIDSTFNPHQMATRAAFGFSMGGFTVQLLSTRKPGYLDHAAIYDGIFPWAKHVDPRIKGKDQSDKIWTASPVFDAALGRPREAKAMVDCNPTDQLLSSDAQHLALMQHTRFWINSAAADGSFGNIDRTKFLVKALAERGMPNRHLSIPFADDAKHDWHWNDTFFYTTLLKMAEDF